MTRGRVAAGVLAAVALAMAAYLRFEGLGQPSYWLDEILGQDLTTKAAAQPWWRWLTGLEAEHGPLYYLTQLATRLLGTSEFAGRSFAALAGVATVLIVALTARPYGAIAALLLAFSPLHVYYSREARPYALLMLLAAVLLFLLLRDAPVPHVTAVLVAMLYTSAVAAPVVAAVIFVRRRYALAAAIVSALFLVLYRSAPRSTPEAAFPPLALELFGTIARAFTVSAFGDDVRGRTVLGLLAFAVIGAVVLLRRERSTGLAIVGMTLLPVVFALASLRVFGHWFALRYLCAGVIGFVLLVAAGMLAVARLIARKEALATAVALLIVGAAGWQLWTAARTEPFRKLDWRAIAQLLREQAKPGDMIVSAEPWSDISLGYYLGRSHRVVPAHRTELAEMLVERSPATWLISAGFTADESVRGWMCRFPLVQSSALESFRMHYAPSIAHYLAHRSHQAEQRALSTALGESGFTLQLGPEDAPLLGDGWAQPEGEGRDAFRWAVARRATVTIPRFSRRDRVIRFHALPVPPQSVRVSLNGHDLGMRTMLHKWQDYEVAAPAAAWRDGLNTLAFDFSHATKPAAGSDPRTLAASFQWIAIDEGSNAERPPLAVRAGAGIFLDGDTAWRNTPTRFPATELNRATVEPLLGRLGYDPIPAWPRLVSNKVHLEDVGATVAYGSDCQDDATFLHHAFAVLLQRTPNGHEERDLLARMRTGTPRPEITTRILKAGDFLRVR